jgi:hypothetical protein
MVRVPWLFLLRHQVPYHAPPGRDATCCLSQTTVSLRASETDHQCPHSRKGSVMAACLSLTSSNLLAV